MAVDLARMVVAATHSMQLDRGEPFSPRSRSTFLRLHVDEVPNSFYLTMPNAQADVSGRGVPQYAIALARPSDLPLLAPIELAAATLLTGHAPAAVLADVTPLEDLEEARSQNILWVALADDVPVGFAHVKLLEPHTAHLDELDVHPQHGRRGLGRSLVVVVCDWAAANDYGAVTLSTFRDVPWNRPFYERLGFEAMAPAALSAALSLIVANETRRGLDPARRVVMQRRFDVPINGSW